MFGSVKSRAVLFLLSAGAVFTPLAEAQQATLSGWFTFIVADSLSEAGLTSETTYFLTEDSGERYELLIDIELMQPLGGPVSLNRKRVAVTGEWEQAGSDTTARFRVSSIGLVVSPLKALPGRTFASDPSPQSAVTGSQAWVTILCRFADARHVTPYPVDHYERMMESFYPGLGHYWNEVSDGNLPDLAWSRVVGWYNLPRTRAFYVSDRDGDGEEEADLDAAVEDCTAAADAEVFFPAFEAINLVFNRNLDGRRAYGGTRRLTKDRQTRFWGVTWLPERAHEEQETWAHEMGHALGLQHSSGPYGQDDALFSSATYDSDWDVMSGGQSLSAHSGYGHLGVHTIAYHKDFLGWIPADRKYVARPNTTRTISLGRLAQPGAEGYLMAEIPIGNSPTDFYTVEARLFAGYDDGIPDEAIVIHKVDTTREDRLAQVVDVDNNGDPNDAGAMWTLGEVFTDRDNMLQVSIDAAYAGGYLVTINTDPATFSACIDVLSAPSHLFGPGRDAASVQVKAAGDCDWSATSNTDWIRMRSGEGQGSGSVRYTVAANLGPTARTGTLTIDGWTFSVTQAGAQDSLFADDMESGSRAWETNPPWALTRTASRSGAYAWTDSPGGRYRNDQNVSLHSRSIDLTGLGAATLAFWHRYDFGRGDRGTVWVRANGRWEELASFTGTNPAWQQTVIDLSPFVGQSIDFSFQLLSDASGTADGWYIDDVAVFSSDFVSQATLENPQPASFQSGIGLISGWACYAHTIVIELAGSPVRAAYGTPREDTRRVCGDANNGFSLLVNWNNLGPGTHAVRALADGVEFARATVRVTTLGVEFLEGVRRTLVVPDFPRSGEATTLRWEESLQNFVITDSSPSRGEGRNRVAGLDAVLENPSLGSSQSGIGIISGWACEAGEIVIELAGTPVRAAYGTPREDTRRVCGDANNGFGLLMNWNTLGPGEHALRALADGVEFARAVVRVTTLGVEFLEDVRRTLVVPDFPQPGEATRLQWEESLQNFVIIP